MARAQGSGLALGSAPSNPQSERSKLLGAQELSWRLHHSALGPMNVVVHVPERRPGQKLPVLVALHGRGEALKGPEKGARGWIDDYHLPQAVERLAAPPLREHDFNGAVERSRLQRLNQHLGKYPYRGLIIVCPYTPDILAGKRAFAAAGPLSEFIVDSLLPKVFRETPSLKTRDSTGIDGVSLGGRAALLVGFERPEAFGTVASLQAAIDAAEIDELVQRAARARKVNPGLVVRILTSEDDYFRRELEQLSAVLNEALVGHSFVRVAGDHSYEFNRGPGVYEMLTFHNWALRGEPFLAPR